MPSMASLRQWAKSYIGYMHHLEPVRWWDSFLILYMAGSRMCRLGEDMSIFARRTYRPSSNSPARILRKRSRLSAGGLSRWGLGLPGCPGTPRYSLNSSGESVQTYALPFCMSSSANP